MYSLNSVGTHDELIKDPEGAYSQLIRLQEGAREGEDVGTSNVGKSTDASFDLIDKATQRSSSHEASVRRSISRASSSSRRSFSFSHNVTAPVNDLETDRVERTDTNREKKPNVSLRRLAYLNKPEIPVLIIGSIGAIVHGAVFPIFSLLLSTAIRMFFEPPIKLRKDSEKWALVFVGLGVSTLIAVPFQNFFFGIAGGKLILRIRSLTFEKVVYQQISWFDDPANSR